jgi:hypothetical protein
LFNAECRELRRAILEEEARDRKVEREEKAAREESLEGIEMAMVIDGKKP